eukprot:3551711-Pleurochrysis_carterae.AAC.1
MRVHEGRVHARLVRAKVLLASLEPGEGGRIVFANEMCKLKAQQSKEDHAKALGVVRCVKEAKTQDAFRDEGELVNERHHHRRAARKSPGLRTRTPSARG